MKIEYRGKRSVWCVIKVADDYYQLYDGAPEVKALKVGDDVSLEDIRILTRIGDRAYAKDRALWLLSLKDYSEKELRQKLTKVKQNFLPSSVDLAIERVKELGLLDDRRYAKRLFDSYVAANNSKAVITRKLFAKGIPRDIIDELMQENEIDPREQILELLEKKYKRKLLEEHKYQQVFGSLCRRGFKYSDVKSAMRDFNENYDFKDFYDFGEE